MSDALESLAELFGALSHPDRLGLLLALEHGERDVASLADAVGLSQPRTSQHLALLKAHGLVTSRKEGRRALHGLADTAILPWLADAAGFLRQDARRAANLASALSSLAERLRR